MEELQKISVKDFFLQVKNMVISPKNALKDMGSSENYQSIAVPQIFLSMAFVPIAMLIAMIIGASEYVSFKTIISMWLIFAGAIMFYYMLITWGLSKLLWLLKDSMGFEGTEQEFNRVAVLSFSAFFIGNSVYWLLTFIDSLGNLSGYLAPLLGAGAAGYVLFMGFTSDFNVSEEKKPVFVGIMIAVPAVALILFHMIIGSGGRGMM